MQEMTTIMEHNNLKEMIINPNRVTKREEIRAPEIGKVGMFIASTIENLRACDPSKFTPKPVF